MVSTELVEARMRQKHHYCVWEENLSGYGGPLSYHKTYAEAKAARSAAAGASFKKRRLMRYEVRRLVLYEDEDGLVLYEDEDGLIFLDEQVSW